MIVSHTYPIAGRSTRPVSFTSPDSQETTERTAAAQLTRADAVSLNHPVIKAGPQFVSGRLARCAWLFLVQCSDPDPVHPFPLQQVSQGPGLAGREG